MTSWRPHVTEIKTHWTCLWCWMRTGALLEHNEHLIRNQNLSHTRGFKTVSEHKISFEYDWGQRHTCGSHTILSLTMVLQRSLRLQAVRPVKGKAARICSQCPAPKRRTPSFSQSDSCSVHSWNTHTHTHVRAHFTLTHTHTETYTPSWWTSSCGTDLQRQTWSRNVSVWRQIAQIHTISNRLR